MVSPPSYLNELSISPYKIAIPYTGDVCPKAEEQLSFGFKNLKIKPSLIETIPELATDATLKSVVRSLNVEESSFFSVGCSSKPTQTKQGHHHQGYIEFSWNCSGCVQDAINYFSIFFHFEKHLREQSFNQPVQFSWIIEEARFLDADVDGFYCAIHVTTFPLPSSDQANQAWQISMKMIEFFLGMIHNPSSTPIYRPLSGIDQVI